MVGFLFFIAYSLIFCFFIYKYKGLNSVFFKPYLFVCLFLFKLLIGVGLIFFYQSNYNQRETSDVFKYFDDSKKLNEIAYISPSSYLKLLVSDDTGDIKAKNHLDLLKNWKNKTEEHIKFTKNKGNDLFNSQRTIIRLNSLFHFVSFNNIYIHTLFMCLIGFIGQVLLFKSFIVFNKDRRFELLIAIFLVPSIAIWSSGLLKESIIFFALGLFVYNFLNRNSLVNILLVLLSLLLLVFSKFYIALILCFALFLYFTSYLLYKNKLSAIGLLLFSAIVLILFNNKAFETIASKMNNESNIGRGGYFLSDNINSKNDIYIDYNDFNNAYPGLNLNDSIVLKKGIKYYTYNDGKINLSSPLINNNENRSYYLLLFYYPAGSFIDLPELDASFKSFLMFFPYALKNAFLEPLCFSNNSKLYLLFFIENIMVLLVLALGFLFLDYSKNKKVILFNLSFAFALLLLIGYTTPIIGNIVRYKAPAITFLLITIALFYNRNLLLNKYKQFTCVFYKKK